MEDPQKSLPDIRKKKQPSRSCSGNKVAVSLGKAEIFSSFPSLPQSFAVARTIDSLSSRLASMEQESSHLSSKYDLKFPHLHNISVFTAALTPPPSLVSVSDFSDSVPVTPRHITEKLAESKQIGDVCGSGLMNLDDTSSETAGLGKIGSTEKISFDSVSSRPLSRASRTYEALYPPMKSLTLSEVEMSRLLSGKPSMMGEVVHPLPCRAQYATLSRWQVEMSAPEVQVQFFRVMEDILVREGALVKAMAVVRALDNQYWKYSILRIKCVRLKKPSNTEKLVSKRNYLVRLQQETAVAIAHLRATSIGVVESILKFRNLCKVHLDTPYTVSVFWENRNYLHKMIRDVSSLTNFPVMRFWVNFQFHANPFMVPPVDHDPRGSWETMKTKFVEWRKSQLRFLQEEKKRLAEEKMKSRISMRVSAAMTEYSLAATLTAAPKTTVTVTSADVAGTSENRLKKRGILGVDDRDDDLSAIAEISTDVSCSLPSTERTEERVEKRTLGPLPHGKTMSEGIAALAFHVPEVLPMGSSEKEIALNAKTGNSANENNNFSSKAILRSIRSDSALPISKALEPSSVVPDQEIITAAEAQTFESVEKVPRDPLNLPLEIVTEVDASNEEHEAVIAEADDQHSVNANEPLFVELPEDAGQWLDGTDAEEQSPSVQPCVELMEEIRLKKNALPSSLAIATELDADERLPSDQSISVGTDSYLVPGLDPPELSPTRSEYDWGEDESDAGGYFSDEFSIGEDIVNFGWSASDEWEVGISPSNFDPRLDHGSFSFANELSNENDVSIGFLNDGSTLASSADRGKQELSTVPKNQQWKLLRQYCLRAFPTHRQSETFWNDLHHAPAVVEAAIGFEDIFPRFQIVPPLPNNLRRRALPLERILQCEVAIYKKLDQDFLSAAQLRKRILSRANPQTVQNIAYGERRNQSAAEQTMLRCRQETNGIRPFGTLDTFSSLHGSRMMSPPHGASQSQAQPGYPTSVFFNLTASPDGGDHAGGVLGTSRSVFSEDSVSSSASSASIPLSVAENRLGGVDDGRILHVRQFFARKNAAVEIVESTRESTAKSRKGVRLRRKCAVRIQALVRGFLQRLKYRVALEEMRKNIAVITIQAIVRGFRGRKQAKECRRQTRIEAWKLRKLIMQRNRSSIVIARAVKAFWLAQCHGKREQNRQAAEERRERRRLRKKLNELVQLRYQNATARFQEPLHPHHHVGMAARRPSLEYPQLEGLHQHHSSNQHHPHLVDDNQEHHSQRDEHNNNSSRTSDRVHVEEPHQRHQQQQHSQQQLVHEEPHNAAHRAHDGTLLHDGHGMQQASHLPHSHHPHDHRPLPPGHHNSHHRDSVSADPQRHDVHKKTEDGSEQRGIHQISLSPELLVQLHNSDSARLREQLSHLEFAAVSHNPRESVPSFVSSSGHGAATEAGQNAVSSEARIGPVEETHHPMELNLTQRSSPRTPHYLTPLEHHDSRTHTAQDTPTHAEDESYKILMALATTASTLTLHSEKEREEADRLQRLAESMKSDDDSVNSADVQGKEGDAGGDVAIVATSSSFDLLGHEDSMASFATEEEQLTACDSDIDKNILADTSRLLQELMGDAPQSISKAKKFYPHVDTVHSSRLIPRRSVIQQQHRRKKTDDDSDTKIFRHFSARNNRAFFNEFQSSAPLVKSPNDLYLPPVASKSKVVDVELEKLRQRDRAAELRNTLKFALTSTSTPKLNL